ncbi:MAG: PAS domain S-box protein [Bradymonadales bacterium]|nr:PAS domain S-box protein [Bradymonadales bacterium]
MSASLQSEETYRIIVDAANEAIALHDPETGQILLVNQALCRMFDYSAEELLRITIGDISSNEPPSTQEGAMEMFRRVATQGPQVFEWRGKDRSGRLFWIEVSLKSVVLQGQRRILAILRDIDERKEGQRKAAESEALYRQIVDSITDGLAILDEHETILFANNRACEIIGYSKEELIGRNGLDFLDKPARKLAERKLMENRSNRRDPYEISLTTKDGRTVHLLIKPSPRFDAEGHFQGSQVIIADITERKRVEEIQRAEHQKLLSIFDSIDEIIYVADCDTCHILYANRAFTKRYGEAVGKICHEVLRGLEQPCPDCPLDTILETRLADTQVMEWQDRVNGRWYRSLSKVIPWTDQQLVMLSLATDLTDRVNAEQALREKEENLRITLDSIGEGVVVTDNQGRVTRLNPVAKELLGTSRDQAVGRPLSEVLQLIDARTRQALPDPTRPVLQQGTTIQLEEQTLLVSGQGKVRRITGSGAPIQSAEETIVGCVLVLRDVTERHWMEEQIYVTRKMESLGRLAGGISHDFQNLLGAVRGYCDLILIDLNRADPLLKDILEIQKAADVGLELSQQLLAFSQKQVLQPKLVDLNEIIRRLERMLRRLIGEDIEFILQLASFLEMVEVDPGKMEQILMNLVLNAREAMPEGGRLILETANLHAEEQAQAGTDSLAPGNYVKMTVTDTGMGMSGLMSQLIFEPFFSTKEQGEGIGIGLATVYGFVRQSGGTIQVSSEPGRGASFAVILPVARVAAEKEAEEAGFRHYRGSETILLVEDEVSLRGLLERALRRLGYQVIAAADGQDALRIAQEHPDRIDLLLTDVILPLVSGLDLAEGVRQLRPDTRVLFTSGYQDRPTERIHLLGPHTHFLKKPFTIRLMAAKVREVLNA